MYGFTDSDSGMPESSGDYFKDEQIKLDIEKKQYIDKFLFTAVPVPRSRKMIDRLNLKSVTLGKGKIFGPEDYLSFTFLTIVILVIFLGHNGEYKNYSFENLENVNIYNALKPSEVVKIYEENEISPSEQMMAKSEEHIKYKNEQLKEKINTSVKYSMSFGTVNDVPKVDIKQKFKESIKK